MAHLSENAHALKVSRTIVSTQSEFDNATRGFKDICLLVFPQAHKLDDCSKPLHSINTLINLAAKNLQGDAVLAILGEVGDLVETLALKETLLRYQLWIAIKRRSPRSNNNHSIPHQHSGLLLLTKYKASLRHTKTRIEYTYCPCCEKTTKDYGGKKHTYHEFGTLLSDVWRDIEYDDSDLGPIISRLADLFGLDPYTELRVLDLSPLIVGDRREIVTYKFPTQLANKTVIQSQLVNSDCLDALRSLPPDSIEFVFTDPPYNLRKAYADYSDDMAIIDYFNWCDQWIFEIARVLKPGCTVALLNIPIWAARHFLYLRSVLQFQNWIVWDALSYPVRLIMPAHYSILCFSKGNPRPLPGLTGNSGETQVNGQPKAFDALNPMTDGYCLRSDCLTKRRMLRINDRAELTDLWWDIHRLKHNARRVDHPTQLPPHLLYRLISIFTAPKELVLDCFNGSGTTTIAADQLGRRYFGIEKSETYYQLSARRHQELHNGIDPFRKADRALTAKNSPVPRLPKQKYIVSKKVLQLDVKRISKELFRLPTREDVVQFSKYPIELYDKYFISWGEVCAAARTTGMTEVKNQQPANKLEESMQLDLELPANR